MSVNLLAAESPIIARLKDQITDSGISIGSAASIVGSVDVTQFCPGIFVQPGESEPTDSSDDAAATVESQTWDIVVIAAAVPDKSALTKNYQTVGLLLGEVYAALAGYSPGAGMQPLRYAGRPEPVNRLGWVEFPIRFTCDAVLMAN